MKKVVSLIVAALLVLQIPMLMPVKAEAKVKGNILFEGLDKENSYGAYLERNSSQPKPDREVKIRGVDYTNAVDAEVKIHQSYKGASNPVLEWGDFGYVEWEIDVPETGLYNIGLRYFPVEGKSANIERELYIDGEKPFNEARSFIFPRVWVDKGKVREDNRGNQMRPSQVEAPEWQEVIFQHSEGLYEEPFYFYLTKGKHTIRLNAVREPIVIDYLKIFQHKSPKSYAELEKEYAAKGYKDFSGTPIKFQAEESRAKSDPMLYPIYDRTNPLTEPYHHAKIRINTIGGYNWRRSGQWIEWKFTVPEDGLYTIGLRYRQNYTTGIPVTRTFEIDGKVPFKEIQKVDFPFNDNWQYMRLGEDNDHPYKFYLTKGEHTLRMTNVIGDISEIIRAVQQVSVDLNQLYTRIIMLTGVSPDPLKDYQLHKKLPDLLDILEANSTVLKEQVKKLKAMSQEAAAQSGSLETLAAQIDEIIEEPDTFAKRLGKFNDKVMGLGTWSLAIKEQPMEIDYFMVAAAKDEIPKYKPGFFDSLVHLIKSFIASFTEDYSTIGSAAEGDKVITVWVSLGQDQANTLKAMIDEDFTPETGIGVNLNIMQGENVLLFATSSGQGPNVALNTSRNLPIDYGIRNALVDLSKLPRFNEIAKRFNKNALLPYTILDKVYGLPQTQGFPVMFYRKDILQNLELEVPDTWEDVYEMVAKLQENNLQFGPGAYAYTPGVPPGPDLTIFNAFLLQNGGNYYNEDGSECILDNRQGIEAFKEFTNLYTIYDMPIYYDMFNRFRTGSIPVLITDYTLYNQLSVAAPEITGLWGIAPVPGTRMPNGDIDRTVTGGGSSMVMLKSTPEEEAWSWEFIDWWTSAETQTRYGRELEALLGNAARYNTSNVEAVGSLAWPTSDYNILMEQWQHVTEIPIVPGSYYTQRHLTNAFLEVSNNGEIPREALTTYVKEINKEITKKRQEFGLE